MRIDFSMCLDRGLQSTTWYLYLDSRVIWMVDTRQNISRITMPTKDPLVNLSNNKVSSKIYLGNSFDVLQELEPCSVHTVVTSPPYWGLREYGTAEWQDGDPTCDHVAPPRGGQNPKTAAKQLTNHGTLSYQYTGTCKKCGAIRIDYQLGTELQPEEYVDNIVSLFREIWRVLREDGTVWLNLGDSYNGSGGAGGDYNEGGLKENQPRFLGRNADNLKPKDLVGIPWRVALALQADRWFLRSDIIWIKPNPMVEGGAIDRPTRAHEYVFLLSKNGSYSYDLDATKVPSKEGGFRNIHTGWIIPTRPFKGAHFATMPPRLAELCIMAGTPERGVCVDCNAPWKRVKANQWRPTCDCKTEDLPMWVNYPRSEPPDDASDEIIDKYNRDCINARNIQESLLKEYALIRTKPATVLDPFSGAATTGVMSARLGRNYVGIELNPKYIELSRERLIPEIGQTRIFY